MVKLNGKDFAWLFVWASLVVCVLLTTKCLVTFVNNEKERGLGKGSISLVAEKNKENVQEIPKGFTPTCKYRIVFNEYSKKYCVQRFSLKNANSEWQDSIFDYKNLSDAKKMVKEMMNMDVETYRANHATITVVAEYP